VRPFYPSAIGISVIILCAIVLWPTTFAQQSAALIGQWSPLMSWSNKAVHTFVLPTGQVLFWPSFALGDNPQLYNPQTMTVTPTTQAGYNIFCAGHSFLANGNLFVTGGDQVTGVGVATASTFDPVSSTWTLEPDMNEGRWYPSNTTLSNGDVLVVAGEISPTAGDDTLPQVFQFASATWRNLTNAQLLQPTYPEMYLLANGTVFNPGPEQQTRFLNTQGVGAWISRLWAVSHV
jgi:Glyoxal oxidase N-terminus